MQGERVDWSGGAVAGATGLGRRRLLRQAGGVWVGLFVTPHDGKNGDKPYVIKAVFDHVTGLRPTVFVRLGAP